MSEIINERYRLIDNCDAVDGGYEITDTRTIPWRTFVVGLREEQASVLVDELNSLATVLRRTAHVEQGGEVHQWRPKATGSYEPAWHDAGREVAYNLSGDNYEARTLYTNPAPSAPAPEAQVKKEHPNLNVPIDAACSEKLNELGDDRGQGLDEYWKWAFRAGWHYALQAKPTPNSAAGSVADDAEFKKLLDQISHIYVSDDDLKAIFSYIDARTNQPAVASAQADKLVQRLRMSANEKSGAPYFVNLVERDLLRAAANEIERLQAPVAAPQPPAAVAPEVDLGESLWGDTLKGLRKPAAPVQDTSVRDAVADTRAKYDELLYAVESKHSGESRHQTALRYIQERESSPPAQSVAGLSDDDIDLIAYANGAGPLEFRHRKFARAIIARISGKETK